VGAVAFFKGKGNVFSLYLPYAPRMGRGWGTFFSMPALIRLCGKKVTKRFKTLDEYPPPFL
jgi:hypothetical protein